MYWPSLQKKRFSKSGTSCDVRQKYLRDGICNRSSCNSVQFNSNTKDMHKHCAPDRLNRHGRPRNSTYIIRKVYRRYLYRDENVPSGHKPLARASHCAKMPLSAHTLLLLVASVAFAETAHIEPATTAQTLLNRNIVYRSPSKQVNGTGLSFDIEKIATRVKRNNHFVRRTSLDHQWDPHLSPYGQSAYQGDVSWEHGVASGDPYSGEMSRLYQLSSARHT